MTTFAAIISKRQIMAATDYTQFHELAEQFREEMSLKQLCEQEGVSYRSYITWRSREGLSSRRKRHETPAGFVEMEVAGVSPGQSSPMADAVHIEFANGLKFDRAGMEVDALVEFLTKIRGALCLG